MGGLTLLCLLSVVGEGRLIFGEGHLAFGVWNFEEYDYGLRNLSIPMS